MSRGPSQATKLVELAQDAHDLELFHTPAMEPFATIAVGGHHENWAIKTRPFRTWLARLYYQAEQAAPGSQAVQDAVGVLEGRALFDGRERPVYVRVAEHEGAIYLDLANDYWDVAEITPAGWRVVAAPPVRFRRPAGIGELPDPERGGTIGELRPFLNVPDLDWPLVAGFLVAMLRPAGPYPALNLLGGQGSAKTTTARALRDLVDPSVAGLRSEPRDMRDLAIAATNGHVVGFDNLSHLPNWLSDGLCRLATGGGFATRELYSDSAEALFSFQRPVVLTGIQELAIRGDLLDRSILLYLPPIGERHRRDEEEFWAAYRAARPRLLGALLDAVSVALRRRPGLRLERLPRMADFALWVAAAAPGLGVDVDDFTKAYEANRGAANDLAIEASPVAQEILSLVQEEGAWKGSATELLAALSIRVGEEARRARSWPRSPTRLSNALRRVQPNLAKAGVRVEFGRDDRGRWVALETEGDDASDASDASARNPHDGHDGHDGHDAGSLPQSSDNPAEADQLFRDSVQPSHNATRRGHAR